MTALRPYDSAYNLPCDAGLIHILEHVRRLQRHSSVLLVLADPAQSDLLRLMPACVHVRTLYKPKAGGCL